MALLMLLNAVDGLLSAGRTRRAAHDLAYGPEPRQQLDIYAPRGGATGRPVVLFFYGGNWDSGSRRDYAFAGRALAELGRIAVVADYRLVHERPYPAFMEDAALALGWVRDKIAGHGGDPERIALAGHSAGAYIALALALDPRWQRQAGVPTGTVRAAIGLSGPYDFFPFDSPITRHTFGRAPDPEATQPINFAHAATPPLLLLTGDADRTVRARNSERLASAILAAGGDATLKLYPGVRHSGTVKALARPFRGRPPVLADIAAFLAEKLPWQEPPSAPRDSTRNRGDAQWPPTMTTRSSPASGRSSRASVR